MTRTARVLVVMLFAFACAHVDKTANAPEEKPAAAPAPKKVVAAKKPAVGEPVSTPGDIKAAPGRPELSSTPTGLMKPGAMEKIQNALRGRGLLMSAKEGQLDDATTTALMAFQKNEQLARTGMPDHETLEHLGLKPKEIFKDGDK